MPKQTRQKAHPSARRGRAASPPPSAEKAPQEAPSGVGEHAGHRGAVVFHHVHAQATALVTIDASNWPGDRVSSLETLGGYIVRIRPPAGATDEEVAEVARRFGKALAVRLLPRPRGEVVPQETKDTPRSHWTMREVVAQLVAESRTADREALAKLVAATMDEVGL